MARLEFKKEPRVLLRGCPDITFTSGLAGVVACTVIAILISDFKAWGGPEFIQNDPG